MNNLTLFLFGCGVFALMLTGLYLSAKSFLSASERPDTLKGNNVSQFRRVDYDKAA